MHRVRRDGRTLFELISNSSGYELIDDACGNLTQGSRAKVWLLHDCGDGTKHRFEIRVDGFAYGKGCNSCGTKKRIQHIISEAKKRAIPVDERDSLFSLKQYYLDRFIKIIADDDKLKTIKRASRTKVLCGCLRNENHSEWETSASSLASGYGCNACGREKSVKSANLSRSIPKTHEESLSSIAKNILERKPAGSKFIRLLEETDMRKEDRLKKSSGRYAIWSCTKCNDEFTAKIYNVANGTSCPKCSRPGSTEKNVISFLRETFTDVQVQQPIGNYFVDARVLCDSTGVYVDIEIDGSQHYERTHVPWYSKLELEEQIARDVEKMRRSASSFIPTVRIPTCAVTRDSRENEEPWKNSLVASIREAAFAAKNSMKRGFIEHEDVMFVVEGHVEKYEAHSVLLKCAFSGGKSVYFGDMLLTTENT